MTDQTPIERAGRALQDARRASTDLLTSTEKARVVYESIDTNQLASALWESVDDKGIQGRLHRADCDYLALAVKNWLTGKDQQ